MTFLSEDARTRVEQEGRVALETVETARIAFAKLFFAVLITVAIPLAVRVARWWVMPIGVTSTFMLGNVVVAVHRVSSTGIINICREIAIAAGATILGMMRIMTAIGSTEA